VVQIRSRYALKNEPTRPSNSTVRIGEKKFALLMLPGIPTAYLPTIAKNCTKIRVPKRGSLFSTDFRSTNGGKLRESELWEAFMDE